MLLWGMFDRSMNVHVGLNFFSFLKICIDYLSYMKSSSDSTYDMKINVVMIRSKYTIRFIL